MNNKTSILNSADIAARIRRMAFEVYEQNFGETEIYLLGIGDRGSYISGQLLNELRAISPLVCKEFRAEIARNESGLMGLSLDLSASEIEDKVVLVIDDVLYSGRTQLSAVAQLLTAHPKRIQTLCLIDRGHRMMPIRPDYVGLELATTFQEHVSFEVVDGQAVAYLM